MRDQGGRHARHCPSKEPLTHKYVPILQGEGSSVPAATLNQQSMQSHSDRTASSCHGEIALSGMVQPLPAGERLWQLQMSCVPCHACHGKLP